MGREVRRVPADWEHPKDDCGRYIPMYDFSFEERVREWEEGLAAWKRGERPDYFDGTKADEYPSDERGYVKWDGLRPDPGAYMPDWPEEERTHLQMYEDTSEGTPISPVMKTPEELARWLADNGASAFGRMTATYEQWLNTIKRGSACSMVMTVPGGQVQSGVAAMSESE